MRRADFGMLLCPEFPLRKPPRITVRGQTVQSGSVLLRKAPLRSRMCPWSTRRPWGPLVFRRATEGSRVQRKGWGVKRGRETLVSLPLLPPPPGGGNAHAMSWRITTGPGGPFSPPAASRCIGGTAFPLLRGKKRKTDGIVSRTAFAKPDRRSCSEYPRGRGGRSSGTGRCSSSCPARYREYAACSQPRSAGSRRETATYRALQGRALRSAVCCRTPEWRSAARRRPDSLFCGSVSDWNAR